MQSIISLMQKKAGIEKKPDEKEHKEQMADTNAYLSIIPLIINELNMPIKESRLPDLVEKARLKFILSAGDIL